jgi:hypothetical protein
MATVDSPNIIQQILRTNGFYPGDPEYRRVYTYWTVLGKKKTYAIYTEPYELEASGFVKNPVLLLADGRLTEEGKTELREMNRRSNGH